MLEICETARNFVSLIFMLTALPFLAVRRTYLHTYTYTYMHIYTYISIYTHTHTHTVRHVRRVAFKAKVTVRPRILDGKKVVAQRTRRKREKPWNRKVWKRECVYLCVVGIRLAYSRARTKGYSRYNGAQRRRIEHEEHDTFTKDRRLDKKEWIDSFPDNQTSITNSIYAIYRHRTESKSYDLFITDLYYVLSFPLCIFHFFFIFIFTSK